MISYQLIQRFTIILEQAETCGWAVNPLSEAAQMDEDFIGRPSRLSRRVSSRTVVRRTLERYLQGVFQKWDDVVSSLNHTSGFKQFSELQIESTLAQPISVGSTSKVTNKLDLIGLENINCEYNFDLVTESFTFIAGNNNSLFFANFKISFYKG